MVIFYIQSRAGSPLVIRLLCLDDVMKLCDTHTLLMLRLQFVSSFISWKRLRLNLQRCKMFAGQRFVEQGGERCRVSEEIYTH